MTRARKNLSLSFYGIPSRFVNEIPEDCLNFAADNDNDSDGRGENFGDGFERFISLD